MPTPPNEGKEQSARHMGDKCCVCGQWRYEDGSGGHNFSPGKRSDKCSICFRLKNHINHIDVHPTLKGKETCCCYSYKNGIAPCFCGCHAASEQQARREESERWYTAICSNVDAKTLDAIREAVYKQEKDLLSPKKE